MQSLIPTLFHAVPGDGSGSVDDESSTVPRTPNNLAAQKLLGQ